MATEDLPALPPKHSIVDVLSYLAAFNCIFWGPQYVALAGLETHYIDQTGLELRSVCLSPLKVELKVCVTMLNCCSVVCQRVLVFSGAHIDFRGHPWGFPSTTNWGIVLSSKLLLAESP